MPALANALGIEMETLMNGEMPVTQDFTGKEIKEYNFRQPDRYPPQYAERFVDVR